MKDLLPPSACIELYGDIPISFALGNVITKDKMVGYRFNDGSLMLTCSGIVEEEKIRVYK